MKKYFFFYLIAAIALCSCVKDEPDGVWGDEKITFESPVISTLTKAYDPGEIVPGEIWTNPSMNRWYPTDEEFCVYAVYTSSNYTSSSGAQKYMEKVPVAYNSAMFAWDPESYGDNPAYYWPKTGYLTFAAFSPAKTEANTISWTAANGFTLTDFTVKSDASKHYDLLLSKREMNVQKSSSTGAGGYNGIPINFEHALSSIVFTAQKADAYTGTTIKVTSVTLLNAYDKGDFTQGLKDDNSNTYSDGCPKWEGLEYVNTSDKTSYIAYTAGSGSDGKEVSYDSPVVINSNDIIVIPQKLDHSSEKVSVKVVFTIDSPTGDPIEQSLTIPLATGCKYVADNGTVMDLDEWKIGKRYIYNIIFGLDKIYFAPTVAEWDNEYVSGPTI